MGELPGGACGRVSVGDPRRLRKRWGAGQEVEKQERSAYMLFTGGVQLNFTPAIEVFYMLLGRSLPIFILTSLKQHMEYFNFRC